MSNPAPGVGDVNYASTNGKIRESARQKTLSQLRVREVDEEAIAIAPEVEKQALRKLDLYLMPVMVIGA
jgi:hypothetical protein